MKRPLCKQCRLKPAAVNYVKNKVTHYRSKCDTCLYEKPGVKANAPGWQVAGYKKKPQCEQCGFKCAIPQQLTVHHIDDDLKNNNWINLKTICSNCAIEISVAITKQNPNRIKPDF